MIKNILLFLLFSFFFSCSENTAPAIEQSLEINIPSNKTSIYATAYYQETKDDLVLTLLQLSKIQFTEEFISPDTLYLSGSLEEYVPEIFSNSRNEISEISLSLTDDWVSIQNANINVNLSMFFKSLADTTQAPVIGFMQFPIIPRKLTANTTYEVIRPENLDLGQPMVYRKFRVDGEKRWEDAYGFQIGFFVETTQHFFAQDTFSFNSIIDENGIVISQSSRKLIITPGNPGQAADTLYIHTLNRRIEDYTDDFRLRDLDYYVNQIQNTPIPLIYRFFE